jgi:hypothetical protein
VVGVSIYPFVKYPVQMMPVERRGTGYGEREPDILDEAFADRCKSRLTLVAIRSHEIIASGSLVGQVYRYVKPIPSFEEQEKHMCGYRTSLSLRETTETDFLFHCPLPHHQGTGISHLLVPEPKTELFCARG